jgi:hypothetical protein
MLRPPTTIPPSACKPMPPTPRRLGTATETVPSAARQYTPPFGTSLKYRLSSASTRGPSMSPYPHANVSNVVMGVFLACLPGRRGRAGARGQAVVALSRASRSSAMAQPKPINTSPLATSTSANRALTSGRILVPLGAA